MSSSRAADCWVVPGGGVEPDEQPATTAVREVIEEAGVVGQLGRRLGVFEVIIIRLLDIVVSTMCSCHGT